MQPMLLYAQMGIAWPADQNPYVTPHGEEFRKAMKQAFLIMLNKKSNPTQDQVPAFSMLPSRLSWADFLEGIRSAHALIAGQFRRDVGMRLQRTDADVAERVMLEFATLGYPCLPIHDSFMTLASLSTKLRSTMKAVVREIHGIDIGIVASEVNTSMGSGGVVADDIDSLLKPNNPLEMRYLAWLSGKQ